MNIYRSRLIDNSGSQTGTTVYIDGVKSKASRIDLDEIIPMPYITSNTVDVDSVFEPKCVVYNNELHVMSGIGYMTAHYKWNGTSWVSVSTLPTGTYGNAVVVYDNKIYIMNSQGYFYSWDGTQWTELARDFNSGGAIRLVAYNNEIYSLRANYFSKYNGSSWTYINSVPYTRGESTATVYDGAIHLLGGSQPSYHYKWDGSSWSSVSTLPANCNKGCSLVYDNKLHLFFNNEYFQSFHYIWDGSSWSEGVNPIADHGTQGVVFNDKIMLLGYLYSDFIEPLNSVGDITVTP